MEFAYAGLAVFGASAAVVGAWIVGKVLLAGTVAALLAGFGAFVAGLGFWRALVLRPAQRRALRTLRSTAESFEPDEFRAHLDSLNFAQTLWNERDALVGGAPTDG